MSLSFLHYPLFQFLLFCACVPLVRFDATRISIGFQYLTTGLGASERLAILGLYEPLVACFVTSGLMWLRACLPFADGAHPRRCSAGYIGIASFRIGCRGFEFAVTDLVMS